MVTVLGVDACRGGWVGVELRNGRFAAARFGQRLDELIAGSPDAASVGVDIPLGLLQSGWRTAEAAARKRLGRRSSSIFATPPRAVLDQPDHASATALCVALTGKGISIQAWGLKDKLLEANSLYERPSLPLYEVHPETSFAELGLVAVDGRKKSWRGQRARLRVLSAAGIALPEDLGPVARVPPDDVLDAAAAAWTAHRIAAGDATSLPDPPQLNERGQAMAIWY